MRGSLKHFTFAILLLANHSCSLGQRVERSHVKLYIFGHSRKFLYFGEQNQIWPVDQIPIPVPWFNIARPALTI